MYQNNNPFTEVCVKLMGNHLNHAKIHMAFYSVHLHYVVAQTYILYIRILLTITRNFTFTAFVWFSFDKLC